MLSIEECNSSRSCALSLMNHKNGIQKWLVVNLFHLYNGLIVTEWPEHQSVSITLKGIKSKEKTHIVL